MFSPILFAVSAEAGFDKKLELHSGQIVVVEEGKDEAASMGSYSIRLYSGENPKFPMDEFLNGVIHERDGVIEKVVLADIDKDGREEIVVIIRNVGTGSYLSADAYSIDKKQLKLRASVTELAKDADPLEALAKVK